MLAGFPDHAIRYTVCLWRLAAHAPSTAQTDCVRHRFYRFFQFIHIEPCTAARITVALLGLDGKPWKLTIDRTNWDFGKVSINILMIAVIWNGVGIPLMWTFLPNKGNSSTRMRTQLLDRLRATFPDIKVTMLTGDHEFIGDHWMKYLAENNENFVLRLRDNQLVARDGYATWSIARIAHQASCHRTCCQNRRCRQCSKTRAHKKPWARCCLAVFAGSCNSKKIARHARLQRCEHNTRAHNLKPNPTKNQTESRFQPWSLVLCLISLIGPITISQSRYIEFPAVENWARNCRSHFCCFMQTNVCFSQTNLLLAWRLLPGKGAFPDRCAMQLGGHQN